MIESFEEVECVLCHNLKSVEDIYPTGECLDCHVTEDE